MATKNSSDEPQADFSTITTEEILGELKNRFEMYAFFGIPNEGEDHSMRYSHKAANNVYEVLGMLEMAKQTVIEGMSLEDMDEDVSEDNED